MPVICSRRAVLRPEERWWLFAMTAAEAGLPEDGERGWRRALYAALSDGNVERRPASAAGPVSEATCRAAVVRRGAMNRISTCQGASIMVHYARR